MTNEASTNNLLKGLDQSEASRVTIIQFADDTFFFCEARKRYIRNLKVLWQLFEWAAGMKVNKEKSELFYTGKVEGKPRRLADLLECSVGTLPSTLAFLSLVELLPRRTGWE